jgi:hypothetical protein
MAHRHHLQRCARIPCPRAAVAVLAGNRRRILLRLDAGDLPFLDVAGEPGDGELDKRAGELGHAQAPMGILSRRQCGNCIHGVLPYSTLRSVVAAKPNVTLTRGRLDLSGNQFGDPGLDGQAQCCRSEGLSP